MTVRRAAAPVRSTTAFRLFSSWPATSSATFGRASKFAPTTPIGIRRSETTRPLASVRLPISRSSGSRAAVARSWRSRTAVRPSSSRSRSIVPSSSLPVAASTSASLAASTSRRRSRSSADASASAAATASSASPAAAAAAARASRSTSSRIGTFVCIVGPAGGQSPLTSREAEGTGPVDASATCPPPQRARCQARRAARLGGCRARGRRSVVRHRTSLPQLRDRPRPRSGRHLLALLGAARPGLRPRRAGPDRHARVDRRRPAVALALRAAAARSSRRPSSGSHPA